MTHPVRHTTNATRMNKGNHGPGTVLVEHIHLPENDKMELMVRSYRQATPEEKQHLLEHVFVGFADDEIKLVYSTEAKCGKTACPFPHTVVTLTVCPKQPCPFPVNPGPGQ